MNICDYNASVETSHQYSEKESPPFAVDDHFFPLKDQYDKTFREAFDKISSSKLSQQPAKEMEIGSNCVQLKETNCNNDHAATASYPQYASHSMPPDLTESTTTDETSCCSVFSAPKPEMTQSINQTAIQSSIITTTSLTSMPLEPRVPSGFFPVDNGSFKTSVASSHDPRMFIRQSSSIGFSELMEAADDSNINFEQSHQDTHLSDHRSGEKLPPLLENQEIESCTLISAGSKEVDSNALTSALTTNEFVSVTPTSNKSGEVKDWWRGISLFNSGSHDANFDLDTPLLSTNSGTNSNKGDSKIPHITRLLSSDTFTNQYINLALKRASESVETQIESDDSFEVSLLLQGHAYCTVEDVMEVISNTDLLNQWCSPIDAIIVTSSSNEGSCSINLDEKMISVECGLRSCSLRDDVHKAREYEAEWIEATTSSLESPSSGVGFFLNAGQNALQSLGCSSYGRITMFIERRHGRIGLTIGPFHGGIYAYHSISVSQEDQSSNNSRIRIIDHVRLTRENQEESFSSVGILGCAMGSCLSHFFFPSVTGYIDQTALSMARLLVLLENKGSFRSGSRPCV